MLKRADILEHIQEIYDIESEHLWMEYATHFVDTEKVKELKAKQPL